MRLEVPNGEPPLLAKERHNGGVGQSETSNPCWNISSFQRQTCSIASSTLVRCTKIVVTLNKGWHFCFLLQHTNHHLHHLCEDRHFLGVAVNLQILVCVLLFPHQQEFVVPSPLQEKAVRHEVSQIRKYKETNLQKLKQILHHMLRQIWECAPTCMLQQRDRK